MLPVVRDRQDVCGPRCREHLFPVTAQRGTQPAQALRDLLDQGACHAACADAKGALPCWAEPVESPRAVNKTLALAAPPVRL